MRNDHISTVTAEDVISEWQRHMESITENQSFHVPHLNIEEEAAK